MKTSDEIFEKLDSIQLQIEEHNLQSKEILSFKEASKFLGFSESSLYKKTAKKEIPFYSPSNKKIYFLKKDLNDWLIQNKFKSKSELDKESSNYLNTNKTSK